VKLVKIMGRFLQTNQWEKLEKAALVAYGRDDTELKSLGCWYQTLILGNRLAEPDEILAKLRETIELGYKNPAEMELAQQLAPIRDRSEFKTLVSDLWTVVRAEARSKFQTQLESEVEHNRKRTQSKDPLGLSDVKTASGEPFWQAGKPLLLILTRVHHDGFLKQVPTLRASLKQHKNGLPVAVLYYQVFESNTARNQQGLAEARQLFGDTEPAWSVATVGQAQKDRIEAALREARREDTTDPLFFPAFALLGVDGEPLLALQGTLNDWQTSALVEQAGRLATAYSTPLERPSEGESPPDAASETPAATQEPADAAEEPAEDAAEEPAEDAAEEPAEDAAEEPAEDAAEEPAEDAAATDEKEPAAPDDKRRF